MCHCREAKDRKYHKPNKEQTTSSHSLMFLFYKPDHGFRYEFFPNYQVNHQVDIGCYSRQVSLQRSLSNKYMLLVQYPVRRAAAEVLFFFSALVLTFLELTSIPQVVGQNLWNMTALSAHPQSS